MQKQYAFNKVLRKIVEQGEPAMTSSEGSCVFYNNGKKCAVGHLMKHPEEASYDNQAELNKTSEETGLKENFLRALQKAHDDAAFESAVSPFVEGFVAKMKRVARLYRLKFPKKYQ